MVALAFWSLKKVKACVVTARVLFSCWTLIHSSISGIILYIYTWIARSYSKPIKSSTFTPSGRPHGPTFDSGFLSTGLFTTRLTDFTAFISFSSLASWNVVTSWGSEKYTSSSRPHPEIMRTVMQDT